MSYTTTTLKSLDCRAAKLYRRGRELDVRIKQVNKALDHLELARRVFDNAFCDIDAPIVWEAVEKMNERLKALTAEAETVWNHYEAIDDLLKCVFGACMESTRRQKA